MGGSWKLGCSVGACALVLAAGCGGRTPVDVGPSVDASAPDAATPLTVQCGDSLRYTEPGRPIALEVEVAGGTEPVGVRWHLSLEPSGSSAALTLTDGLVTGVAPDLAGAYDVEADIEDARGAQQSCLYQIVATTEPPAVTCPSTPITGTVGTPVTIVGQGDRVFTWQWRIALAPAGAHASVDPQDARTTHFTSDLPGTYRIEVTGFGADGRSSTCEVPVELTAGPTVTCPDGPITAPTRRPVSISADATDDQGIASVQWEVVDRPDGSSARPAPANARTTAFTPDRQGDYTLEFTATGTEGLQASCTVQVHATPTPPSAVCPGDVVTEPLQSVQLVGGGVDDGRIVTYHWDLTRGPAGSASLPPEPADAATTTFEPDVAGQYVLQLTVTDDDGQTGSCNVSVEARSPQGLRVEIYWNGPPDMSCGPVRTPGCDGSDVDVHLLQPGSAPWFDDRGDCYWFNCAESRGQYLSWGAPGPQDDPHLDIDDVEGFGPETIEIDQPLPGTYRVGVDFWDGDNRTTASVVVNVFCGAGSTMPVASFGPVVLHDPTPGPAVQSDNDFWRVADVKIQPGQPCQVTDLSRADGTPNIIGHYEAMHTR